MGRIVFFKSQISEHFTWHVCPHLVVPHQVDQVRKDDEFAPLAGLVDKLQKMRCFFVGYALN